MATRRPRERLETTYLSLAEIALCLDPKIAYIGFVCPPEVRTARGVGEVVGEGDAGWGGGQCDLG
jgi:hypothetical protein